MVFFFFFFRDFGLLLKEGLDLTEGVKNVNW